MSKREMLINYVPGEECRIAIVEDGRLEEIYQERASAESHVGNIYKGKVLNVEPSIQAAFVDFGLPRNGFLHISDLHPMYFPGDAREEFERVGMKTPRRDRPPIQRCLRRGQEILVQVLKEGIGTKGPTLTSYLSIPGRFLVMMPFMEKLGVSRKVEDDEARRAMRAILDTLKPPENFGFIIRTAGIGRNRTDLKRDLAYLTRLWKRIETRMEATKVGELYAESDLVIRTIRDVFSTDIDRVIVDDERAAQRASDFLAIASPRSGSKVFLYKDPVPLFHRYGIEKQIETINARVVPLPSGGSLVIDSTEALVAIDVNSGKSRESSDAESNAYRTNLEAADEICRQLRLRDLGGVVVNDFIDMRDLKHRRAVEQRMRANLKNDRARTRIGSISQFGILEMTRQRMRPSLKRSIYMDCPHCQATGEVKTIESVVLDVMRRLALVLQHEQVVRVELTVSPDVAFQLLNRKRQSLVSLEQAHGKSVLVRVNASGPIDFVHLASFDSRGGAIDAEVAPIRGEPTLTAVTALSEGAIEDVEEEEESLEPTAAEEEQATEEAPADESGEEGAAAESETSAIQEASATQQEQADQVQLGPDGQPLRKRRRRRGRRGRGRGGQQQPQQSQQQQPQVATDSTDQAQTTQEPPQPEGNAEEQLSAELAPTDEPSSRSELSDAEYQRRYFEQQQRAKQKQGQGGGGRPQGQGQNQGQNQGQAQGQGEARRRRRRGGRKHRRRNGQQPTNGGTPSSNAPASGDNINHGSDAGPSSGGEAHDSVPAQPDAYDA